MFRKAQRTGAFIKLAITGPAGSGKTTAAILMGRGLAGPKGRIALVDTENRSASLYADLTDFDTVDLSAPYEQTKFVEAIEAAVEGGYEVLVIDSFSHLWEAILQYKDQLDRRGGNSFTNWNAAGERFKDVVSALLSAPLHVICCMRAKMDYVIEENGGKKTVRKVGLAPIMRDGIEFEFTTVFDLDMSHNAATSKDRTRLFDGRIFQITEKTGELIGQWLQGAKPEDITPPKPVTTEKPAETVDAVVVRNATADQVKALTFYAGTPTGRPLVNVALERAGQVSVDTLTEEQAAKTLAWIKTQVGDEKPAAPAEPPATGNGPQALAWLEPYGDKVDAYLLKISWIKPGQTWRELDPEHVKIICGKPDKFARAADIPAPKGRAA